MENETIPNDSEVSTNPEVVEPNPEPTGTTDTTTSDTLTEPTVEDNQLEVLLHIDARLERLEGIQIDQLSYSAEFFVTQIAFMMGALAFMMILRSWITSLR